MFTFIFDTFSTYVLGVLSVLIQHTYIVMEPFGEIFMPPASPNPQYDPRENMMRRIQDIDETERRSNHKTIHELVE